MKIIRHKDFRVEENTYHRLDSIEDVEEFYGAIKRETLTHKLSSERPFCYWTLEVYDKENGIRGGGGLGVLAADTRRVAEQLQVPFVMITPFYPWESHQKMQNMEQTDYHVEKNYADFGFNLVDTVSIKTSTTAVELAVVEKQLGTTRFLCVTEPNFGELYSGESGSDHRLYQEVALGFGGYQALKLVGLKPAVIQLNEVATFFAAIARLDELVSSGMDFYEAVVYTRKHTLYTNHTLVQAAEAMFTFRQFEQYVFPNVKSSAVRRWLAEKFTDGRIKLSTPTIEIAELRSGVSKLHARVANYRDINGNRVKFKAITNGIHVDTWVLPEIVEYYEKNGILDKFSLPTEDYQEKVEKVSAEDIRYLKNLGRVKLNEILQDRTDQYGNPVHIPEDALLFDFKRRFVDYKRPWLPFTDYERLADILEKNDAYYILAGRVHLGDATMFGELMKLLKLIDGHPVLKKRVSYLPDYDEELGYGLSLGSNVAINTPIVGLEACGTSWMKDIANMGLLISTHDGGVADMPADNYLNIDGRDEAEEVAALYEQMDVAAQAWRNDFDLEYWVHKELAAYLPVISGARMMKDYLTYLF
ncbi:MAG: alpha-glucan family phosphorylase [Candidatus Nomurabacteria bacterium]|jgi:starch phosphorylase|nr:alpha-glucan family phosphorylase [Candidatus Nomurabacteria bacterium]